MTPYAPSMKADFDAGRPLELGPIYDVPLATAAAVGAPMRRAEALARQLHFLDRATGAAGDRRRGGRRRRPAASRRRCRRCWTPCPADHPASRRGPSSPCWWVWSWSRPWPSPASPATAGRPARGRGARSPRRAPGRRRHAPPCGRWPPASRGADRAADRAGGRGGRRRGAGRGRGPGRRRARGDGRPPPTSPCAASALDEQVTLVLAEGGRAARRRGPRRAARRGQPGRGGGPRRRGARRRQPGVVDRPGEPTPSRSAPWTRAVAGTSASPTPPPRSCGGPAGAPLPDTETPPGRHRLEHAHAEVATDLFGAIEARFPQRVAELVSPYDGRALYDYATVWLPGLQAAADEQGAIRTLAWRRGRSPSPSWRCTRRAAPTCGGWPSTGWWPCSTTCPPGSAGRSRSPRTAARPGRSSRPLPAHAAGGRSRAWAGPDDEGAPARAVVVGDLRRVSPGQGWVDGDDRPRRRSGSPSPTCSPSTA